MKTNKRICQFDVCSVFFPEYGNIDGFVAGIDDFLKSFGGFAFVILNCKHGTFSEYHRRNKQSCKQSTQFFFAFTKTPY